MADAPPAIVWVDCDVSDQTAPGSFEENRDETDVADDLVIFFPNIAEKGIGSLFSRAGQPAQMIAIVRRAADVAQVRMAVRVHVAAKTHFNQVGSLRQVPMYIQTADRGVHCVVHVGHSFYFTRFESSGGETGVLKKYSENHPRLDGIATGGYEESPKKYLERFFEF